MVVQIDTIYEDGVFKPQEKIAWEIFQKLKQSLTVSRTAYKGAGGRDLSGSKSPSRHARLDNPAPYLIRGHPGLLWIPAFAGMTKLEVSE
ncbi:MAG: hypothetical protein COW04_12470 [Deltaproteobacteria bacterium CG12_big_fil_rev_8_21_14_0_65_43_10]|nr:MAG: hypothetical protein COW04_12470 [Deltaproteobacteria bacterium CG12_big_fil_rev_8_21_14_0_65_43_10]PIU86550.1 MAG: hypothetical protein COS67_01975 [Deltaproteobacteria bacterium CG06_land_8_20_14_3_00_44_19]PIZ20521.1 MAG: hypothetical protein COY50_04340 [Deltaproteobacteria bacterium CG_4_10_14_0_8_um_filter_43_12]